MIKTALKFNIVLFMLILIVSMPLVYADWSDLTVTVDTNVPTYEEIAFIQKYKGLYYIDYFNGKPYIMTDENILRNQYMVTDFTYQNIRTDYEIDGDFIYLYRHPDAQGSTYLNLNFDVDSDDYYIEFEASHRVYVSVWATGQIAKGYTDRSIYLNNVGQYNRITIRVFALDTTDEFLSFKIYVYKSDGPINIIDRPAQTYTYEHSDYTRIGAIILDSYNNFVDSLLNPLDTITGWLKDLGNYIWSTIKRIIDPEGIFLK